MVENKRGWNFYLILFEVVAFIGWLYEFILWQIDGKTVNPGYLNGTYLPIYGFGAIVIIYIMQRLKLKSRRLFVQYIGIFLGTLILATIVEFIGGYILINYFNLTLWDYSANWGNILGIVSPESSIKFAIGGLLAWIGILPIIEKLYKNRSAIIVSYGIAIIMLIDFVLTAVFHI